MHGLLLFGLQKTKGQTMNDKMVTLRVCMVEQQQKSVRSVGGNSPVRSAKIFKFRRFRCKNAHDSLQTYPAREDDTFRVFGFSKRSFLVYGDAMPWSSSWLRGCVKSSTNARCLLKLYAPNLTNYIYDNHQLSAWVYIDCQREKGK